MGAEWVVCNKALIDTDLQRGELVSWGKRFRGDDGGVCTLDNDLYGFWERWRFQ